MDLPHGLSRKRKQVSDDVQDLERAVVDNDHVPSIPRYSHSKRPRLHRSPRPTRSMKKSLIPIRPPPIDRLGNDLEDHGIIIVNNAAPVGPLSGSLRDLRRKASPVLTIDSTTTTSDLPIPFDVTMAQVPSTHPYVSRNTLKELDLDVILRNPQLRESHQ